MGNNHNNYFISLRVCIYTILAYIVCMKKGSHHSEQSKAVMRRKAHREPRPPEIGKKISETKLVHYHPYRGKHLSEDHRKNISESMRKRIDDIEDVWVEKSKGVEDGSNVGHEESY